MKIDKRVIIGGVVVIGGIILLWLLRKGGTSANLGPGDIQTYPNPGAAADQPAPGDMGIQNLPDVGDLPKPRIQRAPAVTPGNGNGCCGSERGCADQGYVASAAPLKIPAQYLDDAFANLQGVSVVDYAAPAPVRDAAGYGSYALSF